MRRIGRFIFIHKEAIRTGLLVGLLIGNFWAITKISKLQAETKNNTTAAVDNTAAVNQLVTDLKNAFNDFKEDNARVNDHQTALIECLLAIQGETGMVSEEAKVTCHKQVDNQSQFIGPAPTNQNTSQNSTSHNSTQNQNNNPNEEQGNRGEGHPPIKVLGLPVCVPVVNLCARE